MDASFDADMSYYLKEESQICCIYASLDADMSRAIFRSMRY